MVCSKIKHSTSINQSVIENQPCYFQTTSPFGIHKKTLLLDLNFNLAFTNDYLKINHDLFLEILL